MNSRNVKEEVFSLLLVKEVVFCTRDLGRFERESTEQWYRGGVMALQSVVERCRLKKEFIKWRDKYGHTYGWKPEFEQKLKELMG